MREVLNCGVERSVFSAHEKYHLAPAKVIGTDVKGASATRAQLTGEWQIIVKFTGSSRAFQPTEGIGVWVYDFAGWKAQSALA